MKFCKNCKNEIVPSFYGSKEYTHSDGYRTCIFDRNRFDKITEMFQDGEITATDAVTYRGSLSKATLYVS